MGAAKRRGWSGYSSGIRALPGEAGAPEAYPVDRRPHSARLSLDLLGGEDRRDGLLDGVAQARSRRGRRGRCPWVTLDDMLPGLGDQLPIAPRPWSSHIPVVPRTRGPVGRAMPGACGAGRSVRSLRAGIAGWRASGRALSERPHAVLVRRDGQRSPSMLSGCPPSGVKAGWRAPPGAEGAQVPRHGNLRRTRRWYARRAGCDRSRS